MMEVFENIHLDYEIMELLKKHRMTEEEYTHERAYWINRLSKIPRRKHFPRCVRYCVVHLAKVEAEYRGTDEMEELKRMEVLWE